MCVNIHGRVVVIMVEWNCQHLWLLSLKEFTFELIPRCLLTFLSFFTRPARNSSLFPHPAIVSFLLYRTGSNKRGSCCKIQSIRRCNWCRPFHLDRPSPVVSPLSSAFTGSPLCPWKIHQTAEATSGQSGVALRERNVVHGHGGALKLDDPWCTTN